MYRMCGVPGVRSAHRSAFKTVQFHVQYGTGIPRVIPGDSAGLSQCWGVHRGGVAGVRFGDCDSVPLPIDTDTPTDAHTTHRGGVAGLRFGGSV